MIAITVLWALFVAYRWLSLDTPASVPQYRDVFYMGHWTAGEFGLNAERIARTHSPFGVVLRSKG